jgi:hypothetical protein
MNILYNEFMCSYKFITDFLFWDKVKNTKYPNETISEHRSIIFICVNSIQDA